MKLSVILCVLLGILLLFWFWPATESRVHLVILLEQQGPLAARDQVLAEVIAHPQFRRQQRSLQVSVVDSSVAPAELLQRLQALHERQPVDLVFGCGDSVCVRNVLPWLEQEQLMLLYPGSSEGIISSRLLIQTGLTASQYLYPLLHWLPAERRGVAFIGSHSARSWVLASVLEHHSRDINGPELIAREFISQPDAMTETLTRVLDLNPGVLLLDTCEWQGEHLMPGILQTLPLNVVWLCPDRRPPPLEGVIYITAFNPAVDHPESRRLQGLYPQPDALQVNAHWLFEQLLHSMQTLSRIDTPALQDFFSMHSGISAAGTLTIDRDFRGSWQRVFLLQQQRGGDQLLWYSTAPLRPLMFPAGQAPSDWMHQLTIYWRNAGGVWRTSLMEPEV